MCMCYFFYFSALNLPNFHCTANIKWALSIFHKYNYYKLQIYHKQTRCCSRSRVVGFVIFLLQQEDEMYAVLCVVFYFIVMWRICIFLIIFRFYYTQYTIRTRKHTYGGMVYKRLICFKIHTKTEHATRPHSLLSRKRMSEKRKCISIYR